jgi:hypothetical protein
VEAARVTHSTEVGRYGVTITLVGGALHGLNNVVVPVSSVEGVRVANDHRGTNLWGIGSQNIGLNGHSIDGF